MIIEVESYYGDAIIFGKVESLPALRKSVKLLLEEVNEVDFLNVFCARYGFEQVAFDKIVEVDYRIDLDTHMVYRCR